jgi:hypothetical protein
MKGIARSMPIGAPLFFSRPIAFGTPPPSVPGHAHESDASNLSFHAKAEQKTRGIATKE